jgi:hypothetical protein
MKAAFVLLAIAVLAVAGCKRMDKLDKHWRSGWNGLDRTISMYSDDGRLMARWRATTYVETDPPVIAFIDSAGKEVKLMGGMVIVQEH